MSTTTVTATVERLAELLEGVFATAQETRRAVGPLLDRPAPRSADLAELQPLLHAQLARHAGLVAGVGFVARPGLLHDVPAWLEWWQTAADGAVRPLLLDLDPGHTAYSDYTHWDWYAIPRDTGQRAISGPYVDYLCSDEYSLTLAVPVTVAGEFAGIAGADIYLRHFEAVAGPALRGIEGPACLVNARGRVAAANTAGHVAGSLIKGPDFTAALARPEPTRHGALTLHPCGEIPLLLVTG